VRSTPTDRCFVAFRRNWKKRAITSWIWKQSSSYATYEFDAFNRRIRTTFAYAGSSKAATTTPIVPS